MADPRTLRVPYSALTFDKRAARYRLPAGGENGGRFLSYDSVRGVIESDIENTKGRMRAIGAQLQAGEITVAQFRDRTAIEIRSLHIAEYAAGAGGFHNLDQSDFGSMGAAIKPQYKYLDEWCGRMAKSPELIQDGVPGQMPFMDRLDLYADGGLSTFEKARLQAERAAGYKWEQNDSRGDAHVCTGENSCGEQDALGVVEVGTLSIPGTRRCKNRDRCKIRRFKQKPQVLAGGV